MLWLSRYVLAEYAKKDNLKLTEREISSLRDRIFFVDSHYDPVGMAEQGNDEQAFECLKDWCTSCDEINRRNVAADTGDVYPVSDTLLTSTPRGLHVETCSAMIVLVLSCTELQEWKAAKDQAAAMKEEAGLAEQRHKQVTPPHDRVSSTLFQIQHDTYPKEA